MKVLLSPIFLIVFAILVKNACYSYACTSSTFSNNVCWSYTASLLMYSVMNSDCPSNTLCYLKSGDSSGLYKCQGLSTLKNPGAYTANANWCKSYQIDIYGYCSGKSIGSSCSADDDCDVNQYCPSTTKQCTEARNEGETCSLTILCKSYLFCSQYTNTCTKMVTRQNGQTITSSERNYECATGYAVNNICKTPPDLITSIYGDSTGKCIYSDGTQEAATCNAFRDDGKALCKIYSSLALTYSTYFGQKPQCPLSNPFCEKGVLSGCENWINAYIGPYSKSSMISTSLQSCQKNLWFESILFDCNKGMTPIPIINYASSIVLLPFIMIIFLFI